MSLTDKQKSKLVNIIKTKAKALSEAIAVSDKGLSRELLIDLIVILGKAKEWDLMPEFIDDREITPRLTELDTHLGMVNDC